MLRLLSHNKVPPSGYWYEQSYVDANGDTSSKRWASTSEIHTLASRVSSFRRANNLPRAEKSAALEDIDVFTATRLGVSAWTIEYPDTKSFAELHPNSIPKPNCPGCGLPKQA